MKETYLENHGVSGVPKGKVAVEKVQKVEYTSDIAPEGKTPKRGKSLAMALVSVLMLALLGGLCSSCKNRPKETVGLDEQQRSEEVAADDEKEQAMSFDCIELKENNGGVDYRMSVLLPVANTPQSTAIRDALMQIAIGYVASPLVDEDGKQSQKPKTGESIKDFARRCMKALTTEKQREDKELDMGEPVPWAWDFSIDTLTRTERYINFAVNGYQYMGGAHGGTFGEGGITFRLSDGKRIADYFKDPDDPAIRPFLIQGLCRYFNESMDGSMESGTVTTDNLDEYLLVDVSKLQLPSVPPCLTSGGVAFSYPLYEIAPYAAGEPSFVIPYDQLESFLTDEVRELIR